MSISEEELFRLSDEELEKMFFEAKADGQSPDVGNDNDEDLEQPVEDSDDNGTEEIELDDEAEEPAKADGSDEILEVEEAPTEAGRDRCSRRRPVSCTTAPAIDRDHHQGLAALHQGAA